MDPSTFDYFLLINIYLHMLVKGDYILRVQVSGYSNPSNTCSQCTNDGGDQVCCDNTRRTSCRINERCDNEFFYCLMASGSTPSKSGVLNSVLEGNIEARAEQLGCLQPSLALKSGLNNNGKAIDFLSGTVLGLPNPLEFEVTAVRWQGIVLYVDVLDDDSNANTKELVDFFLADIQLSDLVAGANMTTAQNYMGGFGIATIELSFQLECLPGFFGEECLNSTLLCDSVPCNNSGICEANITSGFTCTCRGDFTGDTCDVMIDDCLNVNCNNGICVDGVRSFICECEVGYTGQFCDQKVAVTTDEITPSNETISTSKVIITDEATHTIPTDVNGETITTTDKIVPTTSVSGNVGNSSSSSNVGVVAGAVVGSILFILLVGIVVILSLLAVKFGKNSDSKGDTMDNPIYDIAELPTGERTHSGRVKSDTMDNPIYDISTGEGIAVERDLDNPVYGLL